MLKPRDKSSNVVVELMHDGFYRATCSDHGGLTASGCTFEEAEQALLELIDARRELTGHKAAVLMDEDEILARSDED
jgi:predicted RNase H-like HicB family nuclease